MAIYKIFPTKDASIYSLYPTKNTGLDEIIEASTNVDVSGAPQTSRFLVQFDDNEINDVINNKISSSQWQANFRGFVSKLDGLNLSTTLEFWPLSDGWNMGTGRYLYNPEYTNGVSWTYRSYSGSDPWVTSGFNTYVTASYSTEAGGGTWYISSSNATIIPIYGTQTFTYADSGDINTDITNMVKGWYSGSITNNGLIIKQTEEFIDSKDYQITMKFFSIDTHTIYPPCLEFRWRDYTWNTGSSTQSIINSNPATISVTENPGLFYPESINKFRVNARPTYPARTFQTASFYTVNYYLPTASYYAVKDLDTNEYVIDFDNQYTQLSADEYGSYFTLYMNGLEPERYYKILVKTTIGGSTIVFDDDYYFKITNG